MTYGDIETQEKFHHYRYFHKMTGAWNNFQDPSPTSMTERMDGEYCYQKAIQAIQNKEQEELEKEQKQASEQYEAMERANEKKRLREQKQSIQNSTLTNRRRRPDNTTNTNPSSSESTSNIDNKTNRAAGVAVIRTITRQAREKNGHNESYDDIMITQTKTNPTEQINNKTIDWNDEERIWLEKAAYKFLHPKALVRLGNQALQLAKQKQTERISLPALFLDMDDILMEDATSDSFPFPFQQWNSNPIYKAAYLYKLAGQQKSKEGWFNLGHLLWNGFPTNDFHPDNSIYSSNNNIQLLPPDIYASLAAFEKSIQLGDADAMYFVGVQLLLLSESDLDQYVTSHGSPSSSSISKRSIHSSTTNHKTIISSIRSKQNTHPQKQRGLELIQHAANEYQHGGAMYYLALLYLNGDSTLGIPPCSQSHKDMDQFQCLLDAAADMGQNADATYLRAHSYYDGTTLSCYPKHTQKALEGFQMAADLGNSDGAVSAGAMWYERGNYRNAFEWYQKAAEMGNKEGWRNLVKCYAFGEGVMKSESTAKHIAKLMLSDDHYEDKLS